MDEKKKKRVALRRNRTKPPRENDVTRAFAEDATATGDRAGTERVRAKGDISRHRTITTDRDDMPGADVGIPGRVLKVHGLFSYVELAEGRILKCAVRRLLKSLVTDGRNIVTTGDRVRVREAENGEGMIEHVEPRHGVLTRASRNKEHVLVANVDQAVIVVSLVEPDLKPHLIDRYIASALKGSLAPVVCLNKADRIDPVEFQPILGAYAQMGVPALLTSTKSGYGIEQLRARLAGRASVFSGQSGVGKSSLLNAIQPDLALRVRDVSDVNGKGRHTTTTAELIRLDGGGWVVDTPGVRQLQLWDTRPEEVEGYFHEFRPYIMQCKYPDCTHTREGGCAVLKAVGRKQLSERRYISYLGLFRGMNED